MTNIVCVFQAMRAMNEPFESREDAKAEMARMDKDGSMTIDFPEFRQFHYAPPPGEWLGPV